MGPLEQASPDLRESSWEIPFDTDWTMPAFLSEEPTGLMATGASPSSSLMTSLAQPVSGHWSTSCKSPTDTTWTFLSKEALPPFIQHEYESPPIYIHDSGGTGLPESRNTSPWRIDSTKSITGTRLVAVEVLPDDLEIDLIHSLIGKNRRIGRAFGAVIATKRLVMDLKSGST